MPGTEGGQRRVLLTRWAVDWLLRGWKAEEGRGAGWSSDHSVRCQGPKRRKLGRGRQHQFRSGHTTCGLMRVSSAGGTPQPADKSGEQCRLASLAASPARRKSGALYGEREPLQLGGCGRWCRLRQDWGNQDRAARRLLRPLRAVARMAPVTCCTCTKVLCLPFPLILTGWKPRARRFPFWRTLLATPWTGAGSSMGQRTGPSFM